MPCKYWLTCLFIHLSTARPILPVTWKMTSLVNMPISKLVTDPRLLTMTTTLSPGTSSIRVADSGCVMWSSMARTAVSAVDTGIRLTPASPWIPRPRTISPASKVKLGCALPGRVHGDRLRPMVPTRGGSTSHFKKATNSAKDLPCLKIDTRIFVSYLHLLSHQRTQSHQKFKQNIAKLFHSRARCTCANDPATFMVGTIPARPRLPAVLS